MIKHTTPDRIRTCDLRIRNPLLYPAELRAPEFLSGCSITIFWPFCQHLKRLREVKKCQLPLAWIAIRLRRFSTFQRAIKKARENPPSPFLTLLIPHVSHSLSTMQSWYERVFPIVGTVQRQGDQRSVIVGELFSMDISSETNDT